MVVSRRVLTSVASATVLQGGVQAVALGTAILLVRVLSERDFAVYTLATSFVAGLSVVGASGLSSAMQSAAGPRMDESPWVDQVAARGARSARSATIVIALIGVPLATWFISSQAGFVEACVLGLVTATIAGAQILLQPRTVLLQLRGRFAQAQLGGLVSAAVRALAVLIAAAAGALTVLSALVITAATTIGQLLVWRRVLPPTNGVIDSSELRGTFRLAQFRLIPSNIFFAVQSQLLYLVLALLDETSSLARLGALTRYTQLFAVVSLVGAAVVVPRYARLKASAGELARPYAVALGVMLLLGCAATGLAAVAGPLMLDVLGRGFAGLTPELCILFGGAALTATVGLMNQLNQARGWTKYQWVVIPMTVAWAGLLLVVLDLHRLRDAAIFYAASFVPGLLLDGWRAIVGIRSPEFLVSKG